MLSIVASYISQAVFSLFQLPTTSCVWYLPIMYYGLWCVFDYHCDMDNTNTKKTQKVFFKTYDLDYLSKDEVSFIIPATPRRLVLAYI